VLVFAICHDRVERPQRHEPHPPGGGEPGIAELAVEFLAAGQRATACSGSKQQVVVDGGQ